MGVVHVPLSGGDFFVRLFCNMSELVGVPLDSGLGSIPMSVSCRKYRCAGSGWWYVEIS